MPRSMKIVTLKASSISHWYMYILVREDISAGGERLTRKEAILRPLWRWELWMERSDIRIKVLFFGGEGTHTSTINKIPMPNARMAVTAIPTWFGIKISITWRAELGIAHQDQRFDSCTDNDLAWYWDDLNKGTNSRVKEDQHFHIRARYNDWTSSINNTWATLKAEYGISTVVVHWVELIRLTFEAPVWVMSGGWISTVCYIPYDPEDSVRITEIVDEVKINHVNWEA